ncbi:hypothetical protein ACFWPA_17920 [Rhodococcus sp. NPDC058505]|uniref:hypothetical protein n=1 Tax=unclassified Rhodococcus (in: high G+C Gram-positive bacteria) TaxID=192944 RepID=UPI0036612E03
MNQIASWWDGLELWLIGLPYVPQLLLVLVVALPAAYGLARVFDITLARALTLLGRDRARSGDAARVGEP